MAELNVPTTEQIRELPLWGQVAFAARCARRALPHLVKHWPDAPPGKMDAVRKAVEVAERSAAAAAAAAGSGTAANAADDAFANTAAATAAFWAASAGLNAASAAAIFTAAKAAANAAANAADADADTVPMILADFWTIRELARSERWTDATPVPPEVFGPLWPEGSPDGWPAEPSPDTLKLRITVPDHLSDDEALDYVRDLVTNANALHVAGGGHGLKVDRVTFTEPTPDPVPQPDPDLEPIGGGT